uniref:Replication factor A protein 3 n=1 Tax=Eutreptiella gymnastica TaxID=73025 RepID=A0A7S1ITA8_9EUGL|mmetsp:Transcript_41629/g.74715  ORF Transcript_41629/g.74715 Transcript_41629/m.74715 type:complete len:116 (+) Transcript_41629:84-431(+)
MDPLQVSYKPRVNGSLMQRFKGKQVILVAKVEDYDPGQNMATVQTSDAMVCHVILTPNDRLANITEFYGVVTEDGKRLKEISRVDLNDDFDFPAYDQMLNLSHNQFRSLFMDSTI